MESVSTSVARYIEHTLRRVAGPKVLLVDAPTMAILTTVYTHSALLAHEVFLVEMLHKTLERPTIKHFPCVCIVRPTAENIDNLSSELLSAHFRDYSLFFTNFVDADKLQALVNADLKNLVRCVEEVYIDMCPITDETCIIALPGAGSPTLAGIAGSHHAACLTPLLSTQWDNGDISRVGHGLVALMLASNRRPLIRYRNNNTVAARIAADVGAKMRMVNSTFFDLKSKETVLLIVDRADDPVTPLLSQWTYLAMMHEVFGVDSNVVDVNEPGEASPENQHVLSPSHDNFFAAHRYSNWGELCTAVKDLIEAYKSLNNIDLETASIDDFKKFVNRLGDAKHQSTLATRHATIANGIGDQLMSRRLADLAVIEQHLVTNSAHGDHSKLVLEAVADERYRLDDLLRLVILYELRYEGKSGNVTEQLKDVLSSRGMDGERLRLIDHMVAYAGANKRIGDLFAGQTSSVLRSVMRAIGGFEDENKNVLTQHTPHLKRLITAAYNGTLSDGQYPFFAGTQGAATETTRFADIIVFVVGGATYEEALLVRNVCDGDVDNDGYDASADGGGGAKESTVLKDVVQRFRDRGESTATNDDDAADDAADRPRTAKLECTVTLASTAMLTSKSYLASLTQRR
jgi:hypothetical protein